MTTSTPNTSESFVLDASAWIEYLRGTERGLKIKELIHNKTVFVSSFTVFEVASVLGKQGESVETVARMLLDRAFTIEITTTHATNAAQFYVASRAKRSKLSGGDALTYMIADAKKEPLLTCESDFAGLPGVHVVR